MQKLKTPRVAEVNASNISARPKYWQV